MAKTTKQTNTQTGTNNTANPVIFIQRCIQQAVWYFWCKPLKTLMSKMLAHVGWMDFHTRQILPERFHTETLFWDSHIPKERRHTHTHTHTHVRAHTHTEINTDLGNTLFAGSCILAGMGLLLYIQWLPMVWI